MQEVSFFNLNPYRTSLPQARFDEFQLACTNNINALAIGELRPKQIQLDGGIRDFTNWTTTATDRVYTDTISSGIMSFIAMVVAVVISCAFSTYAFIALPIAVLCGIGGYRDLYVNSPRMLQDLHIQTILDAQAYFVNGPLAKGKQNIDMHREFTEKSEEIFSLLRNEVQPRILGEPIPPVTEADQINRNEAAQRRTQELNQKYQNALIRNQRIHDAFLSIKSEDPEKAGRIVIHLFTNVNSQEVREFIDRAKANINAPSTL